MAYVMTYSSLLEDLRRYLERGFTAESDPIVYEQLPRLVTLAERRIATEMKLQGFIKAVTTQTSSGDSVIEKPDGWRETVSMTLDGRPILARSYEYLRNYWPDPSIVGSASEPVKYYADYDYFHWLLVPTPYSDQTLEILYYSLPPLLGESAQTNWLTTFAPQLLLYAALLEATPFLKNDSRVSLWQAMYDRAAQAFATQDVEKMMDRSSKRGEP